MYLFPFSFLSLSLSRSISLHLSLSLSLTPISFFSFSKIYKGFYTVYIIIGIRFVSKMSNRNDIYYGLIIIVAN